MENSFLINKTKLKTPFRGMRLLVVALMRQAREQLSADLRKWWVLGNDALLQAQLLHPLAEFIQDEVIAFVHPLRAER